MKYLHWLFPIIFGLSALSAGAQTPQKSGKPDTAAASAASPKLPPMTLTQQFSGPLQDTAIQRFVDPETGVVCYLYTPYAVPNGRDEKGRLVYGANTIGNISCVAPWKNSAPPAPPR